jgi:hypothetical protein
MPYIAHTIAAEPEMYISGGPYVSGIELVYTHKPATDGYYGSEPDGGGSHSSLPAC